jgi:hypothetical protein
MVCHGFGFSSSLRTRVSSTSKHGLSMEYIPDGLTKKQWEEMKRKEAESLKGKDLGKIGITKFQSRSFEAWQKSGQKNLFPVDPKAPLEAKPYMQRPGGSADGTDLKQKGLKGVGFGKESEKNEADLKYERESQTGFNLPWTSDSLNMFSKKASDKTADKTAAGKTTAAKPAAAKASTPVPKKEEPAAKKGFFGLF